MTQKDYLPRDAEGKVDWTLDCRIRTEVGPYLISTVGRSMFTRMVDPMRERLFDCYPYFAAGETVVIHTGAAETRHAPVTYRTKEQAEEGHNVIANLLERGITDWLRPHGLENARRWGHARRGLMKKLEKK